MDLRINAGYIITDAIHVGNTEFVLGVSEQAKAQFVTWECKDGKNYFFGHYHSDLLAGARRTRVGISNEQARTDEKSSPG